MDFSAACAQDLKGIGKAISGLIELGDYADVANIEYAIDYEGGKAHDAIAGLNGDNLDFRYGKILICHFWSYFVALFVA